jgi:putative tryptophan/tyrosine transport system substrate-binding protein
MRRREFISLLGGVAAWPLAARAQQQAMPVVGFLAPWGRNESPQLLAAFHQGLKEGGFVEGRNVAIEYRLAENQFERLPALAADLVQRRVSVIAAAATPAALAAKAASTTVPVVFEIGTDPVQLGLVLSLNRPGANVTGVTNVNSLVAPKRLELLHEILPAVKIAALLVNPANPAFNAQSGDVLPAARSLAMEVHVLTASTERDFAAVFAKVTELKAGGLVISPDAFFTAKEEQLAALAVSHAVPTIYENRKWVAAGGLIGYGGSQADSYRLTGVYVARVLKGEKPADLPVQQVTKVEMFLNLKSARALGITFPLTLLGRADEVIE